MLPGSMYPKKTYGRSLFVGEFKHAVHLVDDKNVVGATTSTGGKTEDEAEKGDLKSPNEVRDPVQVSQKTLTFEQDSGGKAEKEEDIKVVWKKATNPGATAVVKSKKGPASKAFFTPASTEEKENPAEQVLDLPVVKDEAASEADPPKPLKKKKQAQQTLPAFLVRKNFVPKVGTKAKSSPRASDARQQDKLEAKDKEESEAEESMEQEVGGNEENEQDEKDGDKEEERSKEGELDAGDDDDSEHDTVESNQASETSEPQTQQSDQPTEVTPTGEDDESEKNEETKKSIVIKPSDLSAYAGRLVEDDDIGATNVLEPDAVEDLKRDLAEKGIITLPPSLLTDLKQELPVINEASEESDDDLDLKDDDLTPTEDSFADVPLDQVSDLAAEEKLDRRGGFKTNKSFEIRRLQAKAERLKEDKKRALFGTRFSKLKARGEHGSHMKLQHHETHLSGRMAALKSSLKPPTMQGTDETGRGILKSPSPQHGKQKSSVRIRDPEFEYQEYTDVELGTSSEDSLRPNSSMSFSEYSIGSDESSEGSSFSGGSFEAAYRPYTAEDEEGSPRGSALHRLYDEIDILSPSRLDFHNNDVVSETPRRESKSRGTKRGRIESGTSRVTTRSSLHLTPEHHYPQLQNPSYQMRGYDERPMPLFDSMRHERRLLRSRDSQKPDMERPESRVGEVIRPDTSLSLENERGSPNRLWSRESHRKHGKHRNSHSRSTSRHHRNNNRPTPGSMAYPNMSVAFGPNIYPMVDTQGAGRYTEAEWRRRVEKFFATSTTSRQARRKVRNKQKGEPAPPATELPEAEEKSKKHKCWRRCPGFYHLLDCSKKSLISNLLWIAIPTILCTVTLFVVVFLSIGLYDLDEGVPTLTVTNSTDVTQPGI
ncbi:uncharacterized protein LOC100177922 [Ciona intestinalis]